MGHRPYSTALVATCGFPFRLMKRKPSGFGRHVSRYPFRIVPSASAIATGARLAFFSPSVLYCKKPIAQQGSRVGLDRGPLLAVPRFRRHEVLSELRSRTSRIVAGGRFTNVGSAAT